MALMRLPEFLPDLPDYDNPGTTNVVNLVPLTALSYGPWREPAILSTNQMDARCQGARSGADYAGNLFTFTADAGKIYRYSGSTFADVSKLGGYTSIAGYTDKTSRAWYFTQYNNIMLATNYADPPQKWVMGTDSAFDDMAPLTAPTGKYMGVVQDSLVLANTTDSVDGSISLRLWWGPVGNPLDDDWGNVDKQSDFQTLPVGREITGFVGGEYGTVFCRTAIYRMTYSGGDTIFQFDQIKEQHGCIAPGSIAFNEERIFYLSEHGFQMMVGGQAVPIGQDKIDDTLFNALDASNIGRIHSAIDEERNLYLVALPTSTSVKATGVTPNLIGAFNWHTGRWTVIEETIDLLQTLSTPALTLEDVGALYPIIEDVPGSYENPAWTGGTDFLGGFTSDFNLNSFSGQNKGFEIDTAEVSEGGRRTLLKVRPIANCDCVTMRAGTRNSQSETVQWTESTAPNAVTRLCSFRARGRYHRVRLEAPTGWTGDEIAGIDGLVVSGGGK